MIAVRSLGVLAACVLYIAGCEGVLSTGSDDPGRTRPDGSVTSDGGVSSMRDGGAMMPRDGGAMSSSDGGATMPRDGGMTAQPDGGPPPRPDGGTPPPTGPCTLGPPLGAPIAGCMPTLAPSTGDLYEDCVRRINAFRCECQHLQPLERWVDGEACADTEAEYDSTRSPHAGFSAGICSSGFAQNECPGWPSDGAVVSGCLQAMWDEGPGEFYGGHGHYINMSSTMYSRVACGFYDGPSGVWAVQNFY